VDRIEETRRGRVLDDFGKAVSVKPGVVRKFSAPDGVLSAAVPAAAPEAQTGRKEELAALRSEIARVSGLRDLVAERPLSGVTMGELNASLEKLFGESTRKICGQLDEALAALSSGKSLDADSSAGCAVDADRLATIARDFGTAAESLAASKDYFCGGDGFGDVKDELAKIEAAAESLRNVDPNVFSEFGERCRQATQTWDGLFSSLEENVQVRITELEEDLSHAVEEHISDVVGDVEGIQKQLLTLAGTHFSEFTAELVAKEREAMKAVGAAADGSAGNWLRYVLYANVIQLLILLYILKRIL